MTGWSSLGTTLLCLALTAAAYVLSRAVGARVRSPFTTPVFLSTVLIALGLLGCGLGTADYADTRQLLGLGLGPATVALALPLYRQRQALRGRLLAASAGIGAGIVVTVACAWLLCRALGLSEALTRASAVKSVTVAVAVQMAPLMPADPTLVAGLVIATGMLGAMLGPWALSLVRVSDPLARGLALGTIAHGQGTAQAAVEGELSGAVAALAMGLTAVASSLLLPGLVWVLGAWGS